MSSMHCDRTKAAATSARVCEHLDGSYVPPGVQRHVVEYPVANGHVRRRRALPPLARLGDNRKSGHHPCILSTTSIPSTSVWLPFIIPLEREFLTVTFLTTRASDSSGGIQRGVAAKAMRDATESSGNPGMTTKHAAHRSSFWSSIQWRPRNSAWEMRTWSSLKKRIVSFTLAHAAAWFLAGSSHHHGVPTSMQTSSALAKALLPVIPVSMVWKFMKSSVKCSRVMSSTTLLDPA
ncbi:unnamed protein product [Prorocentrum cordatum]|uniref:Uncharacterized protein n=1 Tax=Prorocentrum cordatum TaxID=2364126 RepID=A0ABN9VPI3_9DINO|nr:unnamed protein product [Polarella glacialis]